MKIGIYTIHAVNNYGAVFQAYATQVALRELGYESEIVNYYPTREEELNEFRYRPGTIKELIRLIAAKSNPKVRLKLKRFKSFRQRMVLSRRYASREEIDRIPPQYDIHLVGSDQVWNLERGFSKENPFFLDFLGKKERKITFASSFGTDHIDDAHKDKLRSHLSSFHSIAVRENTGVNILASCGLNASQVMDPTFLPGKAFWEGLIDDKPLIKGDYIFAYGFGEKAESNKLLQALRSELKIPIVGTSISISSPHDYDRFYNEAGPLEFLNLIKNAAYVITASYHGAAFAIHFRKSFLVQKHKTRNTRMEAMLDILDLGKQQVSSGPDIKRLAGANSLYLDYTDIEKKIDIETRRSVNWLSHTIRSIAGQ